VQLGSGHLAYFGAQGCTLGLGTLVLEILGEGFEPVGHFARPSSSPWSRAAINVHHYNYGDVTWWDRPFLGLSRIPMNFLHAVASRMVGSKNWAVCWLSPTHTKNKTA
jgi:hypothetical protein